MEELTKKWLKRARYDLDTAEAMFESRRYLYVAFMCQQSLEKILKAIIIEKGQEALRTYNLVRLAEIAEVYQIIDNKWKNFLADLTVFAIEARYGDYRKRLSEIINKKMADRYLRETKEIFRWLRGKIKK